MENKQIQNEILSKDYSATILVNASPMQAFDAINNVPGWWARHVEGKSDQAGDAFTVRFGSTFVDFKITEMIPEKKIVWLVTDCNLQWINDKKEWNNTRVEFDIHPSDKGTEVTMTHVGLVQDCECYNDCETGWNGHIKNSLRQLIETGKGMPE